MRVLFVILLLGAPMAFAQEGGCVPTKLVPPTPGATPLLQLQQYLAGEDLCRRLAVARTARYQAEHTALQAAVQVLNAQNSLQKMGRQPRDEDIFSASRLELHWMRQGVAKIYEREQQKSWYVRDGEKFMGRQVRFREGEVLLEEGSGEVFPLPRGVVTRTATEK